MIDWDDEIEICPTDWQAAIPCKYVERGWFGHIVRVCGDHKLFPNDIINKPESWTFNNDGIWSDRPNATSIRNVWGAWINHVTEGHPDGIGDKDLVQAKFVSDITNGIERVVRSARNLAWHVGKRDSITRYRLKCDHPIYQKGNTMTDRPSAPAITRGIERVVRSARNLAWHVGKRDSITRYRLKCDHPIYRKECPMTDRPSDAAITRAYELLYPAPFIARSPDDIWATYGRGTIHCAVSRELDRLGYVPEQDAITLLARDICARVADILGQRVDAKAYKDGTYDLGSPMLATIADLRKLKGEE